MHIHQTAPQGMTLDITHALTLGHLAEGQRFGFSVMENRPTFMTLQKSPDSLPAARLTVLLQHQKRMVGGPVKGPATLAITGKTNKPMQKVVAGIWVGFDVIQQHTGCMDQFR
tara:strand:- start:226 stop:564 length:339 start_codon:yes stop_codon:yes gene_type:complete